MERGRRSSRRARLTMRHSMNPLVSIIIPFYNNVGWLIEAVDSALAQTYSPFEILVVDDGSQEDLGSFLDKYLDQINYIRKENGGPATARNLGIERARGEYIAFLDSDDLWLKDKLSIQMEKMLRYGCVWSCCGYERFGDENGVYMMTPDGSDYIASNNSRYIATPTVVIRTDVLRADHRLRFNNRMRYGQDAYMWLNMIMQYDILRIHDVLVRVRMRGTNASRRAVVQLKARADLWEFRKTQPELLIKGKVSVLDMMAGSLCIFGTKKVSGIGRIIKSPSALEFIAKLFFIIPYVLSKLGDWQNTGKTLRKCGTDNRVK